MFFDSTALLDSLNSLVFSGLLFLVSALIVGLGSYLIFLWLKYRNRESYALNFVTLQIKLPRDNEIKIDAAEQMFAGLYSLKRQGWIDWIIQPEEVISFEIVALKEFLAFYVTCHRRIQDLVEKQINGAYPTAQIKEVDEVNIFSQKGRVAFAQLSLDKANHYPLKTYKDLPTDGLSLITSAMSKMSEGEGAILQIVLQPEGKGWQKKGREHVRTQKKREADPDKASYSHDPKEIEAINNKVEKPGFRVALRIVVSAPQDYQAESHLNNIVGAFAQFTSPYNDFKTIALFIKHFFMTDFLYRYMPIIPRGTSILNIEELATLFHFPNKTVETHHIQFLNAKNAPAPHNIPNEGL
jgi:hypothetical protein